MHNLLIAAAFFVIVLSPCAAALWNGSDPAMKPVRRVKRPVVKRVEQIADEIEAPWTLDPSPRKDILLKCARANQLRHLHLHEFRRNADAASMVRLSVRR